MKKIFLILLITFLTGELNPLLSQVNQAISYFPLKVGNVWVYNCSAFGTFGMPPCYCVRKYRFQIIGTAIRNNKTYFLFLKTQASISSYCSMCYAPPFPDTLRIDSVSGNIYKYASNGCSYSPFEILFDSLTAKIYDTVKVNCGTSQWPYKCIDTSNQNVFASSRKTRSFRETQFEGGYDRAYAQGIGIIVAGSPSVYCGQNTSTLIGCVLDGVLYGDTSMLVGLNLINSEIPENFSLSQNYPNPFNPVTKIKFNIPQRETTQRVVYTSLIVYDVLGKEVQVLVNQQLQPGTYEIDFEGSNLPSGVYYYILEVNTPHSDKSEHPSQEGNYIETRKMVLIK